MADPEIRRATVRRSLCEQALRSVADAAPKYRSDKHVEFDASPECVDLAYDVLQVFAPLVETSHPAYRLRGFSVVKFEPTQKDTACRPLQRASGAVFVALALTVLSPDTGLYRFLRSMPGAEAPETEWDFVEGVVLEPGDVLVWRKEQPIVLSAAGGGYAIILTWEESSEALASGSQ